MKKSILAGMAALLTLSACASIVSKSEWPVSIQSTPAMDFTVTNKAGMVISSGKTPQTITLSSGESYFTRERYTIQYTRNGEVVKQSLTPTMNGWYWGNIIFGGLIGMLIVDPITGAMFRLPKDVELGVSEVKQSANGTDLHIVSIDQLTMAQRAQLVPLN